MAEAGPHDGVRAGMGPRGPWRATVAMLVVLALAVATRWMLAQDFGLFLTDDSPSYLRAAEDIRQRWDFAALTDWRLPGYSLMLAAVGTVGRLDPSTLLFIQAMLGIASTVIAFAIGRHLASPAFGVAVGTFLAVQPVYLMYEHIAMSETLFIFCLMLITLGVFRVMDPGGRRAGSAVALGLVIGLSTLVRPHALVYAVTLLVCAGMGVARDACARRAAIRRATTALVVTALVASVWVARNIVRVGEARLTLNSSRAMLLFFAQRGLIDPTLPRVAALGPAPLQAPNVPYALMWAVGSETGPAERRAAKLVREQIRHHPGAYLRQCAASAAFFAGWSGPGAQDGERSSVLFWFQNLTAPSLAEHNRRMGALIGGPFTDAPLAMGSPVLTWWFSAGVLYLVSGRRVVALLLVLGIVLGVGARWRTRAAVPALALAGTYIVAVVVHAVTMSDYDRYATPYDWVAVAVAALTVTPPRSRPA